LIEGGIQIQFSSDGAYRTGDYWMIPARTGTGQIEWPSGPQPRGGIYHHYCKLALIQREAGLEIASKNDATLKVIHDCRKLFPPLTELARFFMLGGDGQECAPGASLPQLVRVGVMNGTYPVPGARVQFRADSPQARLADSLSGLGTSNTNTIDGIPTNEKGVAECAWKPDSNGGPSQMLEAILLDSEGKPASHPPIHFYANLAQASSGGGCTVTVGKGGQFADLRTAIEVLMSGDQEGPKDLCICMLPGDHEIEGGLKLDTEQKEVNLKITGCGAGTRIALKNGIMFFRYVSALTLESLSISSSEQQKLIQFENVGELTIRSCKFFGVSAQEPLLSIEKSTRVQIENNHITSIVIDFFDRIKDIVERTAKFSPQLATLFHTVEVPKISRASVLATEEIGGLSAARRKSLVKTLSEVKKEIGEVSKPSEEAPPVEDERKILVNDALIVRDRIIRQFNGTAIIILDAQANTLIENNRVEGTIVLYGKDALADQDFQKLASSVDKFPFTEAILHVTGNRLGPLRAAPEMRANVFRCAFFTDNLLEGNDNQIAARHVSLISNSFKTNQGDFGRVGAFTAVYTGNHAFEDFRLFNDAHAAKGVANIGINITPTPPVT